jgi:hypothetical protein
LVGSALLPRGVFLVDWQVPKRNNKTKLLDATVNDGMHVHGVVAVNPLARVEEPLDEHVVYNRRAYYVGKIRSIDVEPITINESYTTEYGLKALKRPQVSTNDVLILPKAASELPSRSEAVDYPH